MMEMVGGGEDGLSIGQQPLWIIYEVDGGEVVMRLFPTQIVTWRTNDRGDRGEEVPWAPRMPAMG